MAENWQAASDGGLLPGRTPPTLDFRFRLSERPKGGDASQKLLPGRGNTSSKSSTCSRELQNRRFVLRSRPTSHVQRAKLYLAMCKPAILAFILFYGLIAQGQSVNRTPHKLPEKDKPTCLPGAICFSGESFRG